MGRSTGRLRDRRGGGSIPSSQLRPSRLAGLGTATQRIRTGLVHRDAGDRPWWRSARWSRAIAAGFGTLAITVWAVAVSGTWARLVVAVDAVAWLLLILGLFRLRRGFVIWAVAFLGIGAAFALGLHATIVEAGGWGAVLLAIAELGVWSIERVSAVDDRAGLTAGRWLGEGVLIVGGLLVTVIALLLGTQVGAAGSAVQTAGGLALIGISALLLLALRHQQQR